MWVVIRTCCELIARGVTSVWIVIRQELGFPV